MPIIDEELFVKCAACGHEAATGIRRTEAALVADPPGERAITCHRCGARRNYSGAAFYHRTVASNRARVDA